MADLVITPADVGIANNSPQLRTGATNAQTGATHAIPVFLASTAEWTAFSSQFDIGTATWGIAITGAMPGDPVVVLTAGKLKISAVATKGIPYVVSAVGGIAPETDLVATDWVYRIGTAESTSVIACTFDNTRIQK